MAQEHIVQDDKATKPQKPISDRSATRSIPDSQTDNLSSVRLQHLVGNRAIQRLLTQRSGEGSFELDDETASRINRERGGGQPLDSGVQAQMGEAVGLDLDGVRVHTSPESDALNRQLGAKAFTTGQDIFFREGAYEPHSSSGQELIGHELTHVVQQSSGAVNNGSGMTVNAPGDAFEQEADAIAKAVTGGEAVTSTSAGAGVQRQPEEEEEEPGQTPPAEEEEEEEPTA